MSQQEARNYNFRNIAHLNLHCYEHQAHSIGKRCCSPFYKIILCTRYKALFNACINIYGSLRGPLVTSPHADVHFLTFCQRIDVEGKSNAVKSGTCGDYEMLQIVSQVVFVTLNMFMQF